MGTIETSFLEKSATGCDISLTCKQECPDVVIMFICNFDKSTGSLT